jgi:predicted ATP-grasp superfamily ATP-dependent carboligase
MAEPANLLIFGASTRAAAFSALRAGMNPWCADLFADADLQARCPVTQISAAEYPEKFRELARVDIFGPWMYTGALENYPSLIHDIALRRTLLGNDQEETGSVEFWHPSYELRRNLTTPVWANALGRARSPEFVVSVLSGAELPFAALFDEFPDELPSDGRWLVKPRTGAGGRGIRLWTGQVRVSDRDARVYLQEYIEGDSCSAVYVGDEGNTRLLGVTRQLIGENQFHAKRFQYCGSIGPLELQASTRTIFERLGRVLSSGCGLRGLFGVDCVLVEGVPYPVEVNPRYTASVEVLEYATGTHALALHRAAFEEPATVRDDPVANAPRLAQHVVGKAILFARQPLTFPEDGPWMTVLRQPPEIWELPAFADIPHSGHHIEAGRPILTLLASAASVSECRDKLWEIADELERCLYVG